MAVSIQQLIQGQLPLVSVELHDTLQCALSLMIENNFSQLPVLENGKPYGNTGTLITTDSIVRALQVLTRGYFKSLSKQIRASAKKQKAR